MPQPKGKARAPLQGASRQPTRALLQSASACNIIDVDRCIDETCAPLQGALLYKYYNSRIDRALPCRPLRRQKGSPLGGPGDSSRTYVAEEVAATPDICRGAERILEVAATPDMCRGAERIATATAKVVLGLIASPSTQEGSIGAGTPIGRTRVIKEQTVRLSAIDSRDYFIQFCRASRSRVIIGYAVEGSGGVILRSRFGSNS